MPIDDHFINHLPENALLAEQKIIDFFYLTLEVYTMAEDKSSFLNDFIEIFSFYQVYAEKHELDVSFPKLGSNNKHNLELLSTFFRTRHRIVSNKVEKYAGAKIVDDKKTKFKALLFDENFYELTSEELKSLRMQLHILKNMISESSFLDSSSIKRFSKRIDNISKELKIEMSSLDSFWGLIGEAGVMVGKGGDKANKTVEQIRDIIHIIWFAQSRSENLSDEIPIMFLSYKEKTKEKPNKV